MRDDGWIEWAGGDCPVAGDVKVYILCRGADEPTSFPVRADHWYWKHDLDEADIIAYKIISDAE